MALENRRLETSLTDLHKFKSINVVAHCFGLLGVTLIGIWMGAYETGFRWSSESPDGAFRFHPLLMAVGMQLVLGEALLAYRTLRFADKSTAKKVHVVLHSVVLIVAVVGLKSAFDSHNYAAPPIRNLYTVHSWIGIGVVVAFCIQFAVGFVAFYYPGLASNLRGDLLPVHKACGVLLFVTSTAVALMGISERAAWHVKCWSTLCTEGYVANFAGLLLLVYSCAVVYLICCENFKRSPVVTDDRHYLNIEEAEED